MTTTSTTSTVLGMLTATLPGQQNFRYALTAQDAVWLARVLAKRTETQGRSDERAFLWRLLRHFAVEAQQRNPGATSWAHPGRSYPALHEFLRRYAGANARTPWSTLPAETRQLVLLAVSGRSPSPLPQVTVTAARGGWRQSTQPAWQQGSRPRGNTTRSGWRRRGSMYETAPAGDAGGAADASGGDEPAAGDAPAASSDPSASDASGDSGADSGSKSGAEPSTGAEPSAGSDAAPPTAGFPTPDGNNLVLTPDLLRALITQLRRRRRRPSAPFQAAAQGNQPGFSQGFPQRSPQGFRPGSPLGFRPGFGRRRPLPLSARFGALARGARRIGTLRSRRTGARFPVFGGRVGRKNFRVITRPRGGRRFEIMTIRNGELEAELNT